MGRMKDWQQEQIYDCMEAFHDKRITYKTARARLKELHVEEDYMDELLGIGSKEDDD